MIVLKENGEKNIERSKPKSNRKTNEFNTLFKDLKDVDMSVNKLVNNNLKNK